MSKLRFGTGGIPISTEIVKTSDGRKLSGRESGIYRIAELGLDHLEMEFVHGVKISEEEAIQLGKTAKTKRVTLSMHGSYYINLASLEKPKYYASINRVKKALWAGSLMGAKSVTFHPAFYQGRKSEEVADIVVDALIQICKETEELNSGKSLPLISPETTGKVSQWGSVEEILQVADRVNNKIGDSKVAICIDFAHLHARSNGKMNTYKEFTQTIKKVEDTLGKESLSHMHFHVSGINYNEKGERNHLNLKDSDLNYKDLMKALNDLSIEGFVACESPNLEDDALLLKETYKNL